VIIGVVVLAAVLIGGGIFGFLTWQEHQRSEAYAAAVTLMDEKRYEEAITAFEALEDYQDSAQMIVRCQHFIAYGAAVELYDAQDYEEALDAFEALGSFEDSEDWCEQCRMGIVFEDASSLFEAGDIAGAREQFVILENRGFSAADGWVEKCDYLLAEALFDAGKRYDAYVAFLALGDYEDAAARAEACKVSAPSTGELWHNGSYPDGGSTIEINCANVTGYYYFKIYSGSTEVATMFINGGGSVAVDLPPGGYTIKEATGADWWGTDDLFGPRGSYSRMIYDDGSDSFYLAWNEIVTITLNVSDGNVGSQNENLESF
jgi:hypothetical protein